MTVLCFESEIERMGRLAYQFEVWACQAGLPVAEMGLMIEYAEQCQNRRSLLLQGFHRCEGLGCANLVAGAALCARCEDEKATKPYPFASVLTEPLWTRVIRFLERR